MRRALLVFALLVLARPAAALEGRLILDTFPHLDIQVHRDDYEFAAQKARELSRLPDFDFEYVADGDWLIPLHRGSQAGAHPHWELILEPGRISQGLTITLLLPFALQERDSNCMHNGILTVTLDRASAQGQGHIELSSETCYYLQLDLHGELPARFERQPLADADEAIAQWQRWRQARLPTASFESLAAAHPGVDLAAFAGGGKLPAEHMSAYGLLLDGVHYRSDCPTRTGSFPLCEQRSLPSYSLAKTLVAGLGLMALEKQVPGAAQQRISDWVPECRSSGNWHDVSFEQALNMLTGNYGSALGRADEASQATDLGFFAVGSHAEKINYACNAWPRRIPPGSRWVYHTTDTYILGTAMNALWQDHVGPHGDFYRDLLWPMWEALALSPALEITRRSSDSLGQPLTGYGLTLLPDDVVRLAASIRSTHTRSRVDLGMLRSALQEEPASRGSFPVDDIYYYRHGFWGIDVSSHLGCSGQTVLPFMSGFGGINVVLFPNDSIYYYFGDSGQFAFLDAIKAIHGVRPLCETTVTHNEH